MPFYGGRDTAPPRRRRDRSKQVVSVRSAVVSALRTGKPKESMGLADNSYFDRETVPHDPAHWVELRQLGFMGLKHARDVKRREMSEDLRVMGGDLYTAMIKANTGTQTVGDPINTHDVMTLADLALVNWNYERGLPAHQSDPRKNNERLSVIGDLGERDLIWIARYVMDKAGVDNAWGKDNEAIDVDSQEVEPRRIHGHVPLEPYEAEYDMAEGKNDPIRRS